MNSDTLKWLYSSVGLIAITLTAIFAVQGWSLSVYTASLYTSLIGSILFIVEGFIPSGRSFWRGLTRTALVIGVIVLIVWLAIRIAPVLTENLLF